MSEYTRPVVTPEGDYDLPIHTIDLLVEGDVIFDCDEDDDHYHLVDEDGPYYELNLAEVQQWASL